MNTFKKFLIGGLTGAMALTMAIGLAACDDNKDPGKKDPDKDNDGDKPQTEFTVTAGYGYFPPDQKGYGLALNLYADGTYYFNQFTQVTTRGRYTATEATGTTADGDAILYTVTFTENDIFHKDGETATHQIVKTDDGYELTNMFDNMSQVSYSFNWQKDHFEEVVEVVATYWSNNYETDFVKVQLFSNDTYALDGINGVGQAGSMGTYTTASSDTGVTYTLTDGEDSSKTYTITVGATIALKAGTKDYAMTDLDPDAVLEYVFSGTNAWGASVVLTCYSNAEFTIRIALEGVMDFIDAKGTWSAPSATLDFFGFVLNGAMLTAEKADDGMSYKFEYTIAAAQFNAEKVTLSYALEAVQTAYSFTYNGPKGGLIGIAGGFGLTAEDIKMAALVSEGDETVTFTGNHTWGIVFTLVLNADGTCKMTYDASVIQVGTGDEASGTWTFADDAYSIVLGGTTYTATVDNQ